MRLYVFFVIFTFTALVHAEVYKWVDEYGKTHYGDKPANENAEPVRLNRTPGLEPDHNSRAEKQRRLLEAMDDERQETKQLKAQEAADKKKRKANCVSARNNLQKIYNANFLYKKSTDPRNPIVYSDEERKEITAKAEKAVKDWCN